jgi:hypothetical protein
MAYLMLVSLREAGFGNTFKVKERIVSLLLYYQHRQLVNLWPVVPA